VRGRSGIKESRGQGVKITAGFEVKIKAEG
jgi:hypothetical protein